MFNEFYNYKLKQVIVSPTNNNFRWTDDNLLLGKTNVNSDEFKLLVFACKDIKYAKIPSNIKCIGPYCFSLCQNLRNVEFSSDSELRFSTTESLNAAFSLIRIIELHFLRM